VSHCVSAKIQSRGSVARFYSNESCPNPGHNFILDGATFDRMNNYPFPDEWNHIKRISFGDIRRSLEGASLLDLNAILRFVGSKVDRIRPTIEDQWLYDLMSLHFLDCIARLADPEMHDESIHSPFEAALNYRVIWSW